MMTKYFLLMAAGSVFLTGCTLAPDYERPASPVADAWPQAVAPAAGGESVLLADLPWRSFYRDPRLQELIALALEHNRDLRVAVLNVELVRAQYNIQRSTLLPTVSGNAGMSRQHTPADLSGTGVGVTGSRYDLGVGVVSYEIDLFGRIRSLNQQAMETYLATQEARNSAQIALIAAVADQYLLERARASQLEVARQTLKTVSDSLELIRSRYELGDATLLDLRTAEAQVQSTLASVAQFEEQGQHARNGLRLLVGTQLPDSLPAAEVLEKTDILADVFAGLPSDLLLRRPDIRAAEHNLIGANANIGAARAAFFPSIYLTASGGTASAQLSDLFSAGSGVWQFAPTVSVPIFTGGRNIAALRASKVGKEIEVVRYEQAIETAFREASDALTTREWIGRRLEASDNQVAALQERYELANARYERGVDNYLAVLTAQQDLFRAQQELIGVRLLRLGNLVDLYKVTGGGWSEETTAAGTQTAKNGS